MPTTDSKDTSIKVKASDGTEVFFKLKQKTKMRKVFKAFYQKTQTQPGTMRFVFDGKRIKDADTVQTLDIHNNGVIDAMVEQTGGEERYTL